MQRWAKSVVGRVVAATLSLALCFGGTGWASDHFDSPAMTANPQADVGDLYAWTAADGRRLNLVMTVAGHSFSDRLRYEFHIDSGKAFGRTSATTTLSCRFPGPKLADCRLGTLDAAYGNASDMRGLESRGRRFRVFAGLRDDPFYNNVKGSLAAYAVEAAAVKAGAPVDAGGCAHLSPAVAKEVMTQWGQTDGGPATNLLGNWTASAIVISVDLNAVTKGGKMLAVWGSTRSAKRQLDRMARPFVGNTLLGVSPFSSDEASGAERERYNALVPSTSGAYAARIAKSLAFQDGLDGVCGNQLLADKAPDPASRYRALALVFADDRLWVNSASRVCTQFFAVEMASMGRKAYRPDCGGRSPLYAAPNVWRSLLVSGTTDGVIDGLQGDEHRPSDTEFPFLAPPDPHGIDH